ncbi:uncharacterized protein Spn isoform X15 [Cherax quadricarinatus]|uniref:uncharacterized protein Spn isoform X15 n=1 Tax=Cherax quadricarinatus TaxID=27406 RepID=UPI00387E4B5A
MGTRGDVLASRKPFTSQMARHPTCPDHQGVVEEGRGRATTSSKVSKIAGMFQGGGSSSGGVRPTSDDDSSTAASSSSSTTGGGSDGPSHATVVRTESHLARFNNARALFEKMGQGEVSQPKVAIPTKLAPSVVPTKVVPTAVPAKLAPVVIPAKTEMKVVSRFEAKMDTVPSEARKSSVSTTTTTTITTTTTTMQAGVTSLHLRRTFGDGYSSEERGRGRSPREESISPARSVGEASSSSSRSTSPSPARTTNGHAHHQDVGGGLVGIGLGVAGLGMRRPGSASSRSLSTSSTESEPPRRWPPKTSDCKLITRPEAFKSELSTLELRKAKPEKPLKPESLERKFSTHEQHQELIARHKNWFQSFSKNRSPASSPSKSEPRPTSPSKAEVMPSLLARSEEGRPTSPLKVEVLPSVLEGRPISPVKTDWRSTHVTKLDLRSPRSMSSSEECDGIEERARERDERCRESEEGSSSSSRSVSEQEAWSSVLQSRSRVEGETGTDWRRERAAILSGRSGQRHSSSEDEVSAPVKGHSLAGDTTRFEDTATLQSGWSPPRNYNQSEVTAAPRDDRSHTYEIQPAGVKTLKEEINVAATERARNSRHVGVTENGSTYEHVTENGNAHELVTENGSAHEHLAGETCEKEDIVGLEKKEQADLIVSESVVIKDSATEKDGEKKAEPLTKTELSGLYRRVADRPKKPSQSKETSEEVNHKLKESISGHSEVERRDFRRELEERRLRREDVLEKRREDVAESRRRRERADLPQKGVRGKFGETRHRESSEESREARHRESSEESRGVRHRESSEESREEVRHRESGDEGRGSARHRESSEESRGEGRVRERGEERVRATRKVRESRAARERKHDVLGKVDQRTASTERGGRGEAAEEEPHTTPPAFQFTPLRPETTPHIRAEEGHTAGAEVVVAGIVNALKADTVYVSSTEDLSQQHDLLKLAHSSEAKIKEDLDLKEKNKEAETVEEGKHEEEEEKQDGDEERSEEAPVRRQLFPDLVAECESVPVEFDPRNVDSEISSLEVELRPVELELSRAVLRTDKVESEVEASEPSSEIEESERIYPTPLEGQELERIYPPPLEGQESESIYPPPLEGQESESIYPPLLEGEGTGEAPETIYPPPLEGEEPERAYPPPLSPRAQSLAALDALIHGYPQEAPPTHPQEATPAHPQEAPPAHPQEPPPPISRGSQEDEEEIVYDHTVTSAQHKLQFCTTPVTVGGLASDLESHDTDPEPLPPPIPPHGVESGAITEVHPVSASEQLDPDFMTPDEAQRLLSANILEGKFREAHGLLSDEEAQEVVLLLSPQEQDTSKCVPPVPPHHPEAVPSVPPHYADTTTAVLPQYTEGAPPVPSHYTPGEDEYDTRVASHFDPTLTSPLSPEDAPSEADSSETSGDVYQVSRVKEVLVEDGVHYLEDGHFWVEIPGLPDEDEDEDNDPSMPFHPHTKLTFSKDPVQVFSTYSVTEYDRKNDDVDPVAASAEYELEKRVEKMDLFPVEIVKGEGGLGLSIIGMGVGADAGVEKLGIFVKTITPGGATERDRRIQVNDQIIEVDGKSLVGVTQVFAASVLKNTSGRVHFLIGREKDPENSEVALLIKQSLQADREREERRRALGGPDYDPHTGHGLFDPLSSPSEENSRSEEASMQHNYSSYLEGGSSPTSPEATSPPPEVFDLEGDTDTSPDNDVAMLKLKLKEVQYRNAVAEAEITKLKMTLLEMEKVVTENTQYTSQLLDAQNKMVEMDCQLQSKLSEVSTYQDMLEQSQGQFIVLEKKYYKAKKIIKEYQGRERDFLHREEYHITQLEEKDSHYNALVKALKDRVISLEAELTNAQKKAGLPVQVPTDTTTQPAYWNLQQSTQSALAKLPVKEELDEAVPPHELLDVSASRAKGELASRGGLANRHLPSLKKTTSMSSASSQDQSLDDSSLDEELPEAVKPPPPAEATQDGQQDQGSRRSAEPQESSLPPHSPPPATSSITQAKLPQPPSYTQATMGSMSHLGSPPPYHHPPIQFASPRQPFTPSYVTSDPSIGLPTRPLGGSTDVQTHQSRSESRPEIPYRHPPPVARVQPVNRAEISESASLAAHLANRTPQQQSLAEQLKALLAERELDSDGSQQRSEREASPSKRSPTSLMEDVRQAVLQADVSSSVPTQQYWQHLGKKPVISAPVPLSSTAHGVVGQGQVVHPVSSPQRLQSAFYSPGGRESVRDSSGGSPRLGRSSIHASPLSGVSANPSGVVLLSQKPLDSSLPAHKLGPGVDGSSGDLSSGPASLGSGDEGSGASLGSQSSLSLTQPPTERTKRSHMWQTAPVVDWTKEQVSQWLVVQGLESCVGRFQDIGMTGPRLLNLDVRDLKSLGLPAEDKSKLKRKVKELRLAVEKERKQAEKEKKEREKLQKKAEKLAEKAEKKKK